MSRPRPSRRLLSSLALAILAGAPGRATHLEIQGPSQLRSGGAFRFTAVRVSTDAPAEPAQESKRGQPLCLPESKGGLLWTVLGDPQESGLMVAATGEYLAPRVEGKSREVTLLAVDSLDDSIRGSKVLTLLAETEASDSAPAGLVTIEPQEPLVFTQTEGCRFTARLANSPVQPQWIFKVLERDHLPASMCGGFIQDQEGGWIYQPPPFAVGTETYTIQATAKGWPALAAVTRVKVENAPGLANPLAQFDPHLLEPQMTFLAGSEQLAAGFRGGRGGQARFRGVAQAIHLNDRAPEALRNTWLVADSRNQALRVVARDGATSTWWADPERSGGQDWAGQPGPVALAVPPGAQDGTEPWQVVMVDATRNAVYVLDEQRTPSLLAGEPGKAGCRDGAADQALFMNPRGVAVARDGAIYVADRGNGVIRRIKDGQVVTWAGSPDPARLDQDARLNMFRWPIKDGRGLEAAFRDPRHLVLDEAAGCLYVSDWHCIRRIRLADAAVTTPLGSDRAGFESWKRYPDLGAGPERLSGVACFCSVAGLALERGQLFICDQLNSALRVWNPVTGDLTTLVGGNFELRTRSAPLCWGRMRHGRDLSSAACASMPKPMSVAFDGRGGCLLTGPNLLAELALDWRNLPGCEQALAVRTGPGQSGADLGAGDSKESKRDSTLSAVPSCEKAAPGRVTGSGRWPP